MFFITRDQYILRASVFGSMISSTEWREDNVIIAKDQSEFSMSAAAVGDGTHNVSLAFMNFNMSVNAGRYSLVVINPVGTFIVGTWQVQQAGKFLGIQFRMFRFCIWLSCAMPCMHKAG